MGYDPDLLARQDLLLRRRLRGDIYKHSSFVRGRMDRVGLDRRGVKGRHDLTRIPPMTLGDVPTVANLLLGSSGQGKRRNSPRHWTIASTGTSKGEVAGALQLAYSRLDVELMGRLGAEVLERARIGSRDLLVNATDPTQREHLQLSAGAEQAAVGMLDTGPKFDVDAVWPLDPSVIAGEARTVIALLDRIKKGTVDAGRLYTAIVVGESGSTRRRKQLDGLAGEAGVQLVRLWAPQGVMAAWSQCRDGVGLHTFPEHELIELVDPISGLAVPEGVAGKVLWTGLDWRGSALVRLDTEVMASMETEVCDGCGRKAPRLVIVEEDHQRSFCDLLDEMPGISTWAAELHATASGDQLVIWVAPEDAESSLTMLGSIGLQLGGADVRIAEAEQIDRKVLDSRGERFGDRRAFPVHS